MARGLAERRVLPRKGKWGREVLFLGRKPLGVAGLALFLLLGAMAVAPGAFGAGDPLAQDADALLLPPSLAHPFGTDNFGRDLYSRVLYGARLSLSIGLLATLLGTGLGALVGLVGAFLGRWVDNALQRLMDALFAFPRLVLAMALVTVLGPDLPHVVLAIALPMVPWTARVVRSAALTVNATPYMEAARALGAGPLRLLLHHLAPNCLAPYIVIASAQVGSAILLEASLAFLGMGAPPPAPSWGRMLSLEAMRYFELYPWLALFPGLAVSLTVCGANLFGDALRDLLDPRLRGR